MPVLSAGRVVLSRRSGLPADLMFFSLPTVHPHQVSAHNLSFIISFAHSSSSGSPPLKTSQLLSHDSSPPLNMLSFLILQWENLH
jgi:hypothetical protein